MLVTKLLNCESIYHHVYSGSNISNTLARVYSFHNGAKCSADYTNLDFFFSYVLAVYWKTACLAQNQLKFQTLAEEKQRNPTIRPTFSALRGRIRRCRRMFPQSTLISSLMSRLSTQHPSIFIKSLFYSIKSL